MNARSALPQSLATLRRGVRRLAGLARNRDGGVAVTFGLSMIPLTMVGLTAIDFHRASSIKLQLQDALDAATLAAARSSATTQSGIQTIGGNVLSGNLKTFSNATLKSSGFTLKTDGTVTSSAQVAVKPMIANLWLGGDIMVGAASEVKRANKKLEIALVLDTTGSMAGTKLSNLKTAGANLIETLSQAAKRSTEADAVRISLVPFSNTVRLPSPSTYKTASFMDQTGASPINNQIFTTTNQSTTQSANRWTLFSTMKIDWAGCVESRQYPYDVQDTGASTSTPATLFTPYFYPDTPDVGDYNDWNNNYSSENNYIDDGLSANSSNKNWWKRQGSTSKYKSSGLSTSNGKGPNRNCTMEPLTRLTTDYQALKDSIKDFVATGNTNIPNGLMWGWHTLSPNTPFGDGKAYGTDKLQKVAILMTDGDNVNGDASNPNDSDYSGLGFIWQNRLNMTSGTQSQRTAKMDARLAELCTNMKAKGVEIYTVRVEVDGGSSNVLKNCATDANHFFDVSNSSQLDAVFQTIAGSIANLHISK